MDIVPNEKHQKPSIQSVFFKVLLLPGVIDGED